ncbi:uncharacterized protein LOC107769006 [Nicotiana tabacum]|uniref:Uncharacterized protein LOC107769006 n=1 Tax=Nicotiana tabacum TaxID=4097 RepID=A0AC58SR95_TOBAC
MVDTTINLLEILYKCDDDSPPMMIHNDIGLRVYIELKKKNYAFNEYPLCITVKEKDMHAFNRNEENSFVCLQIASTYDIHNGDALQLIRFDNVDDPEVVDFDETSIIDDPLNSKILPLAYAIVDKKNDASWGWFFERFKEAFGGRDDMCIVSNRNESIAKAASIVYPQVSHYVCIWHLWNHINDRYKRNQEKLREIIFATARAYTIQEFNHHMTEMEQIDGRVKDYLFDIGYHRWCRAHAKVNRTMTMISNIAESLNSATREARELPIQQLLEEIRMLINRWNYTNRNTAQTTFTKLIVKYNAILDENFDASQHMMVRPSTENLHLVIDSGRLFIVCLRERTCSCRRFQLDQIPCPHAWVILRSKNLEGEDYCFMYYNNEYMLKAYDIPFYPLPDKSTWTIPVEVLEQVVLPPVGNKIPGRPKKVRY